MGPRRHRKRLNAEGLPVDANDWTPADWQDLHEAVERVKRNIARRHANAIQANVDGQAAEVDQRENRRPAGRHSSR